MSPCVCTLSLSQVQLFLTLWTVAHQAPLSMGFSRKTLLRVAISFSRGSPDPGIEPAFLVSCIAGRFFTF